MKCQIHDNNCFNGGRNGHNSAWPLSQEAELGRSGPKYENFQGQWKFIHTQACMNYLFHLRRTLWKTDTRKMCTRPGYKGRGFPIRREGVMNWSEWYHAVDMLFVPIGTVTVGNRPSMHQATWGAQQASPLTCQCSFCSDAP